MPKRFTKQNVNEDQKGRGDCVARAITKASSIPYYLVREDLLELCRKTYGHPDWGVPMQDWRVREWMKKYGFQHFDTPHNFYLEDVPNVGRYVALTRGHAMAVVDGTVYDTGNAIARRNPQVIEFWLWVGTKLSR